MNAAILESLNTPLHFTACKTPEPGSHEVLVKLKNSALNHRDVWIQKGQYPGIEFPLILGSDGAGIIASAGENVQAEKGMEIIINPNIRWGDNERVQHNKYTILGLPQDGTFSEFITVNADRIHPKPAHLSFEQAAALPLAGLTAFRALFIRANIQPGEKLLITGIGGGVALFVLQFAVAAGAEVFVTSGSDEKLKKAIELGAAGGVNYKNENWFKTLKSEAGNFDVIIDSAAGDQFSHLIDLAAPGGRIAMYGGTLGKINNVVPGRIFWKQLSILGSTMGSDSDFEKMLRFVNDKKIVPVVDSVFKLSEVNAALKKMDEGKQFGKIILFNQE